MKYIFFSIAVLSLCFSCKTPSSTNNNSVRSEAPGDSSQYAHIFSPWDGHWQGQFYVLSQPQGQLDGQPKPQLKSVEQLMALKLDTSMVIQVEQWYESTSPYYQKVKIIDTYQEGDKMKEARSEGYNVVRGDSILCVVHKPDETVVHQGRDLGEGIIIWARELKNPLKSEYFYETASDSAYTIVGWGYYGSDDLSKTPKTYFFGAYSKLGE